MPISIGALLLLILFAAIYYITAGTNKRAQIIAALAIIIIFGILLASDLAKTDFISPVYSQLLLATGLWAMLIAQRSIKRRAGVIVLKLRRRITERVFMLAGALCPLFFAFLLATPNIRNSATGQPIYDESFFTPWRMSLVVTNITLAIYFFYWSLSSTEFREYGIVQYNTLRYWTDFESFQWETNLNHSLIDLFLTLRKRSRWSRTLKLSVNLDFRADIEELLNRKLQQARAENALHGA